jgi:chemotaxis protein MotA
MEFSIIIGYVAVILALIFGIVFGENGIDFNLMMNFLNGPSLFIVIGGVTFALLASFPFQTFKHIPRHLKMIISKDKKDPNEYIEIITELSKEARKKGLLALEEKANAFEDEFLKESVLLIVDAIEPDKLKIWFDQKLEYMDRRNAEERKFYEMGATLGPAFGMLGTLIGLVNMLKAMSLDGGAEALGANMSVALITTFYGSMLANCFFIPMNNKLEMAQEREMLYKEMIIEGVISIKEGENPKYIQEKLQNFLAEHEVFSKDLDGEGGGKKKPKKEKKDKKELKE